MNLSLLRSNDYINVAGNSDTNKLLEVGIDTNSAFIPLKEGSKAPIGKWKKEKYRVSEPTENYAVYPVGDLAFVDIDDREKAPDKLLKNTQDTFTVSSPHGDHRWIICDGRIPNVKREWGEIRTHNQYVVGPGSTLTDCKYGCCSESDPGVYTIKNDSPICRVSISDLDEWIGGFDTDTSSEKTTGDPDPESLPDIDTDAMGLIQESLKNIQSEATPFFKCLMDRLTGGRGDMADSLTKDNGKIDRSQLDFVTIEHLFGVFQHDGYSREKSREMAYMAYNHYSKENPYTKDGQARKWVSRGHDYRDMMLRHAIRQYDGSKFRRLLNKTNGAREYTGEYSEITYANIHFAIELLMGDYDPSEAQEVASVFGLGYSVAELGAVFNTHHMYQGTTPPNGSGSECEYPTPKQVRCLCSALDENSEKAYRRALIKLRKHGEIKLACLKEGVDYRVYPRDCDNPPNAEWVKCGGSHECLECGESMLHDTDKDEWYCPMSHSIFEL